MQRLLPVEFPKLAFWMWTYGDIVARSLHIDWGRKNMFGSGISLLLLQIYGLFKN